MSRKFLRNQFLDSLRLFVRGGAGGMGFPKYGGVGGKGGDIYVVAKEGESLKNVLKNHPTKRVQGGVGGNSNKNRILGMKGEDKVINVPVGITIIDEHKRVLGELNEDDTSVLVARGGPGGAPHNQFSGVRGQALTVMLDLKLIADIGLVGFPNAGKSTLLKAISNAKPKIASYPFTTMRPNIGVMEYSDRRQVTMADLPGLIEGAHVNIGMGHRFLKHVERTKLLLLVVDIEGFRLSPHHPSRSCLDTVVLLNKELELYKADLLYKPAIIVVNKMDVEGAQMKYSEIRDKLKHLSEVLEDYPEEIRPSRALEFDDIIAISAREEMEGVIRVKNRLRELLDFHAEVEHLKEAKESKLVERLQQQRAEVGPRLV